MASTEEPKPAEETTEESATTEAEVEVLEPEAVEEDPLAVAERQAAEYLELAQRSRAEMENFRRRTQREREDLVRFGGEKVVKDLLSIVDDAERALEHAKDDQGTLAEGFRLMHQNLIALLERHHVTEVPGVGEVFNPDFHEAIANIPSEDVEKGAVAVVYQKGYLLHDRLIRAAMVAVSAGS